MVSASIARFIEDAGLSRFLGAFSALSDQAFLGLMMSDFQSFGVTDLVRATMQPQEASMA
jgi:kinesin family member 2/24